MTERKRLISYLLYGLFSAEKKGNVFQYPLARARGHLRVMRSKPEETVSSTMRQFLSSLRQDLGQI